MQEGRLCDLKLTIRMSGQAPQETKEARKLAYGKEAEVRTIKVYKVQSRGSREGHIREDGRVVAWVGPGDSLLARCFEKNCSNCGSRKCSGCSQNPHNLVCPSCGQLHFRHEYPRLLEGKEEIEKRREEKRRLKEVDELNRGVNISEEMITMLKDGRYKDMTAKGLVQSKASKKPQKRRNVKGDISQWENGEGTGGDTVAGRSGERERGGSHSEGTRR